jgi:hypothetical protein
MESIFKDMMRVAHCDTQHWWLAIRHRLKVIATVKRKPRVALSVAPGAHGIATEQGF